MEPVALGTELGGELAELVALSTRPDAALPRATSGARSSGLWPETPETMGGGLGGTARSRAGPPVGDGLPAAGIEPFWLSGLLPETGPLGGRVVVSVKSCPHPPAGPCPVPASAGSGQLRISHQYGPARAVQVFVDFDDIHHRTLTGLKLRFEKFVGFTTGPRQ